MPSADLDQLHFETKITVTKIPFDKSYLTDDEVFQEMLLQSSDKESQILTEISLLSKFTTDPSEGNFSALAGVLKATILPATIDANSALLAINIIRDIYYRKHLFKISATISMTNFSPTKFGSHAQLVQCESKSGQIA